jgi:hypothetical protein
MHMKRIIAATATAIAVVAAGSGVAMAFVVGPPEVDVANATIQMGSPTPTPTPVTCAGEDGNTYQTYSWNWAGGETGAAPATDYNLSGSLKVKNVQWTINLTTGRGVLEGTATLTNSTTAGQTYSGPLVLITQGVPAAGAVVPARGWINAKTFTRGVADGGSLLANVEMQITPGFSANGEFGNGSMGFPDWSVAYNNKIC